MGWIACLLRGLHAAVAMEATQLTPCAAGPPPKERGTPTTANEAERLEAVWAHKSTFSKGLALFNSSPVKGIKFCVAQGLVEHTPQVGLRGWIDGGEAER